jgi:hypothetical protein
LGKSDLGRVRSVLQVAINLVFGAPFLWCLVSAVRGPLWWGSHRLLGDGVGRSSTLVWVTAAALGALWLGVSLMLATLPARKAAGVLLVLAGCALLVGFHP